MKKILITLLFISIFLISSCGENKVEDNIVLSEEKQNEIIFDENDNTIDKEKIENENASGSTVETAETVVGIIEPIIEKKEITVDELKIEAKKEVLSKMNEGKIDSEDIGTLAWTIETEEELFEMIEKLESREEYIYYYKFWNELQFAKFTSNYCSKDGYKELLKKLETQSVKVKNSELWSKILDGCGLDEEVIFSNNTYVQLETIHNQYQAQKNFDKLASYDCKNFLSIELENKCRIMKFSLVEYSNKTCNDLIDKEDKEICNELKNN